MKAQELRIGNLVSYSEETRRITQVSENLVWLQTKGCEKASILAAIEGIEPIPLTEEWLLKLGFKRQDRWFESEKGDAVYCLMEVYVKICKQSFIPVTPVNLFYTEIGKEIKYVHQLQNLYFALTGEELFCSPNKPLSQ